MKKQIAVFLGLIFSLPVVAFAQTRTVTNSDLEKFRQKRLQAEREYRENYEKWGFPSPEELEARRIESRRELTELSARLEAERLEREALRAEAETDALRAQNDYLQSLVNDSQNYRSNGYIVSYLPYGYYNYNPFYRSGYFPRRRYGRGKYRNNQLPPIKPPRPIRAPWIPGNYPQTRRDPTPFAPAEAEIKSA